MAKTEKIHFRIEKPSRWIGHPFPRQLWVQGWCRKPDGTAPKRVYVQVGDAIHKCRLVPRPELAKKFPSACLQPKGIYGFVGDVRLGAGWKLLRFKVQWPDGTEQEFATRLVRSREVTDGSGPPPDPRRQPENEYLFDGLDWAPRLSIIILTYNALDYTKKCYDSILRHTTGLFEVIVVDNASTDGTRDWWRQIGAQKRNFRLVVELSETNLGVAAGRNKALTLAQGQYATFLDNDTEVGRNWDSAIISTFEQDPEIWVVGKAGCLMRAFNLQQMVAPPTPGGNVDVVPGYCLTFPRRIIDLLGNLHEGLGKYWHEDLDFCQRVIKYGKRVVQNPTIPVVHHEHKSVHAGKVSAQELYNVYEGARRKAKAVHQRLTDTNILIIYRLPDYSTFGSFDVLANLAIPVLRQLGLVVLRKPSVLSSNLSFDVVEDPGFDVCKSFEMEYNGRRMITLYLENDRPPRTWLKEIELVDVVWTSSPHTLNALARAGVPQDKLQAGGLIGYDADSFNLAVPAFETLPDGNPDFFTFLTVGAAQPRKGTDILLQAFSEEFKKDEPVQLIIKNYYYGQKRWVEAMLDDREGNHAPILHLYDTWDLTKLARYYKTVARHGAFVVPHRGEGFGLPQLEALACGCRLGTTDYGGPATNLRPEDPAANASLQSMVTLFPYRVVASTFHNNPQEPYYEKGEDPQWAEPDVAAVRAWMRRVYQEKYSEDDAQRAAQYVSQQFSMVERTKRFYELLKKL